MKKSLNGILFYLKVLLSLSLTLLIGLISLVFVFNTLFALVGGFDVQVLFSVALPVFVVVGAWVVTIKKTSPYFKLSFALALFLYFYLLFNPLPSVKKVHDTYFCLDSGGAYCAEGVKTKIDEDLVEINKENCLKYNREWDDDRKWCNLNRERQ